MISEFIIAGAGLSVYRACEKYYKNNKWKTKDLKEDIRRFNEVCKYKDNQFLLIDGASTKYGSKFITSLKNKSYKELEDLVESLEIEYKTDVEITRNDNKCTATIDIFKNKLDDLVKYKPIELEPYELYISLSKKFELMTANMNDHTHMLLSGANGSGKSKELQIILTNLIYPNKKNVEIYISNKTNSPDFREFLNCHQVRGYVDTMSDTVLMLEHIMLMFEKRLRIINSRSCDNILDYNKKNKNKQMSYVYVVIDEFAQYFPDDKDEDEYNEKNKGKIMLKRMAEILRKTGIFLLISTQRPDTNSLSPSMKCNLRTKIAFAQENQASSLVVADDTSLVGIPNREFLYMFGSERIWCRSLFINTEIIRNSVKDSIIPNRQSKDDFNVFLKIAEQKKQEEFKKEGKDTKDKGKAIPSKVSKKIIELEVATEEIKESKSRVKNIEVIEVKTNDYRVEDGKILLNMRRVEG